MNIAKKVKDYLTPKVNEAFGIEIVETDYSKKQNGMNLTVYIDKVGGITIDDCEKVHRFIDPLLDELNPTVDMPYILNVSSCGLDWKLVSDSDFKRVLGEEIEVSLFTKFNGKKEYVGRLLSFDATSITINEDGIEFSIPRNKICKATKYLDF